MLLVKFSWRKNLKRGCILRRPCLCDEPTDLARVLCPVHVVWPRISAGKGDYDLIFPSLTRSNFNRRLKAAMLGAGFSQGGEFSPHCFRRGATQEMSVMGSSEGQIKAAGCWSGMGFRSYTDTQISDALKISRLIAKPSTSDSEDDPEAPEQVALGNSIRKKLRPFPGRVLSV